MSNEILAMILAGGQGSRLGVLTKDIAKPAVPFGAKFRIIDFALSNCRNSNINTVGVLTQYKPRILNKYLANGSAWDLDSASGGLEVLPPYVTEHGGSWYEGTADAIFRNLEYLDEQDPEYVLILSGDHVYQMDYEEMLEVHKKSDADATIAVLEVPWDEASRFGVMSTDKKGKITDFEEKPAHPSSNLASMGIYIFNYQVLRSFLIDDNRDLNSSKDFGKDIIPKMIKTGRSLFAYNFDGYWRDVGTVESFYDANMDLLNPKESMNLFDSKNKMYSNNRFLPPHYIGMNASVQNSIIAGGSKILGKVRNSIVFPGVQVGEKSVVENSILLPNSMVNGEIRLDRSILCENSVINEEDKVAYALSEYINKNVHLNNITVIDNNTIFSNYKGENSLKIKDILKIV